MKKFTSRPEAFLRSPMCFKLGELFCGPGGMAIASTLVKPVIGRDGKTFSISHSWGVDYSHSAIATFRKNLGEESGVEMDVRDFVNNQLTESRKINALAFGFPCNSFSSVGEREGMRNKRFGMLYQAGIKVMERYAPDWFIAENVSGINGHDSGEQFQKILRELANAGDGYEVVAHLYKFEEYGVPQARHRYVIVGIRSDIAENGIHFRIPAPTHGVAGSGLLPFISVREALSNVKNEGHPDGTLTKQSEKVIWRLKFTPPGGNAWKLDELVDCEKYPDEKLIDYLEHLPWYEKEIKPLGSVDKIRAKIEFARLHCSKARMSHIYRRLDPDKPSYTITGSGGGGTHVYHWAECRALTNRERAAIQTFPDNFKFCGSKEEVRRQIGMAVPTEGAKIIFEAILKTFAGENYESVEADANLIFNPPV